VFLNGALLESELSGVDVDVESESEDVDDATVVVPDLEVVGEGECVPEIVLK
jgi:hypothetical protein